MVAAYLLIGQLLVIPVGFGTSAHLIGTGLAVALVGPSIAIVCVATVVVLQALVLADGGITAIGLNIVNDGIVPALVAYGVLCAVARSCAATVAGPQRPPASLPRSPRSPPAWPRPPSWRSVAATSCRQPPSTRRSVAPTSSWPASRAR